MPIVVELEQGTEGWLKWRAGGLGASDASTVMDANPHATPYELWRQKTGRAREQADNAFMKHGRDNEQRARDAYCIQTGQLMFPVCLQHDEMTYLRASLDGLSEDGRHGVEIKCPATIRNHLTAREGRVPGEYYAQVQMEMAVSGAVSWDYFSYWAETGEGILVPVEPDEPYIDQELLPRLEEFWGWVKADRFPLPEGERVELNEQAMGMWQVWVRCKRQLEEATEAEELARAGLRSLMGLSAKVKIGDVGECSWQFRRGGPVSYQRQDALIFVSRRLR